MIEKEPFTESHPSIFFDVITVNQKRHSLRPQQHLPSPLGLSAATHARELLALSSDTLARPEEEWVHLFRISFKRQLALWRLISPFIPRRIFLQEKERLGIAGRKLSPYRNKTIALLKMKKLADKAKGRKETASASRILAELEKTKSPDNAPERALKQLKSAQSALKASLNLFLKFSSEVREWGMLEHGLDKAYRKARQAGKISAAASRKEFHYWRKKVKDLGYQLMVLSSLWPLLRLKKFLTRLENLQELLGDANDLSLLDKMLGKNRARFGNRGAVRKVSGLIHQHIRKKHKEALRIGEKLLHRNPHLFLEILRHSRA